MPKLSVIVPVYMVERFLPRCIESIIRQSYRDIEIILIDDGSLDNCPHICDKYAALDDRVLVIHQKNSGVSVARNRGLEIAKGEFITFVDSDDFLDLHTYEYMVPEMENGADIVVCGYDYVDEEGNITRPYQCKETEYLNQREIMKKVFDMPPSIRLGVCNKIFKKILLHTGRMEQEKTPLRGIQFTEGLKGAEDGEFLIKYLDRCEKAVFVHKPLYKNCERVGSATRGGLKSDAVLPALKIYKFMSETILRRYPEQYKHCQAYFMDICLLNCTMHGLSENDDPEAVKLLKMIRGLVRKEFPSATWNDEICWKTRIFYLLFAIGIK